MKWFWKRRATTAPVHPVVRVHDTVLAQTPACLQAFGDAEGPHEGIVYWAGRADAADWIVTTVIVPEALTTWGSFRTSAAANARVVALLAKADLVLLGQVHSHPGTVVDHSGGDDRDALMPYPEFLSIIVPNYGRTNLWPLNQCGVHRFEHGRFRRLTNKEIGSTFRCIPAILRKM
jgi:proteasome lid subunit RPN8/RPN11